MSRRHFWGVDSHLMFLNFSSLEPFILTWHSPAEWWMRACGDYSGYWIAASWCVAKIWNVGHVDFAMVPVWWDSWDGRKFVFVREPTELIEIDGGVYVPSYVFPAWTPSRWKLFICSVCICLINTEDVGTLLQLVPQIFHQVASKIPSFVGGTWW